MKKNENIEKHRRGVTFYALRLTPTILRPAFGP